LLEDWVELHGDRGRADDAALVIGLGRFNGRTVAVVGTARTRHQGAHLRNFGMAHLEVPVAMRLMELADRHGFPFISLVDIPRAYPRRRRAA
jgi:acetyl-CoA carboxylase carboxyl transferase subunit alpha